MGPPAAGLSGNGHGSPLRRLPGWLLEPPPGGHRRLHGWTEALSTSGQRTVPGGLRSGSHWTADTSSDKGNRLGQRQCLHQPEADTVVRGTRNRVHPFLGLLQERPGLNRGEQRGCGAPPCGASPLLRPAAWTDRGPRLPDGAAVGELLPAFFQAVGGDSGGNQGRQALHFAGHAS